MVEQQRWGDLPYWFNVFLKQLHILKSKQTRDLPYWFNVFLKPSIFNLGLRKEKPNRTRL